MNLWQNTTLVIGQPCSLKHCTPTISNKQRSIGLQPAQVDDKDARLVASQKVEQTVETEAHYNTKHFTQPHPVAEFHVKSKKGCENYPTDCCSHSLLHQSMSSCYIVLHCCRAHLPRLNGPILVWVKQVFPFPDRSTECAIVVTVHSSPPCTSPSPIESPKH